MKKDDIVTVLRGIGIANRCIKPAEAWVSSPCPLAPWTHPKGIDRRASFGISINEDGKSGFSCLSCSEHGNLIMLVERLQESQGKDYSELLDFITEKETVIAFPPWETPIIRERQLPDALDEEYFDELFEPAWKSRYAKEYIKSRNLPIDLMVKFDLRWDAYRRRILFKAKRDGLFYGVSGRVIDEYTVPKAKVYNYPASLFLLGEEHINRKDTSRPIVVIEGLMGLLELDSCNLSDYADCVALQGSRLSIEQRDRLVDLGKQVLLFLDNDEAGRDGIYGKKLSGGSRKEGALSMLSGLIEVHAVRWPKGINDFRELTSAKLKQIITKTWSLLD